MRLPHKLRIGKQFTIHNFYNGYDLHIYINTQNPEYGKKYDIGIELLENNQPIGYITIHDSRAYNYLKYNNHINNIGTIFISEHKRGQKIGNILVKAGIDTLKHLNPQIKYLELDPADKAITHKTTKQYIIKHINQFKLIKWYKSIGFNIINTQLMKGNINYIESRL